MAVKCNVNSWRATARGGHLTRGLVATVIRLTPLYSERHKKSPFIQAKEGFLLLLCMKAPWVSTLLGSSFRTETVCFIKSGVLWEDTVIHSWRAVLRKQQDQCWPDSTHRLWNTTGVRKASGHLKSKHTATGTGVAKKFVHFFSCDGSTSSSL